jgi:two-component system cell cycle sensor histidine kinase/response regulator CckA
MEREGAAAGLIAAARPLLDAALDAVIVIDERGTVLEFNASAERMFGYTRDEAVGAELALLIVPPALREQHRAGLRRCLETGPGSMLERRLELPGMRADGTEIPVELTITRAGTERLFVGYLRDLSAARQAERRSELRYALTEAVVAAASVDEAAAGVLSAVCGAFDWALGYLWRIDDAGRELVPGTSWRSPGIEASELEALSRECRFPRGVGLPGRAWESRRPLWLVDFATRHDAPRSLVAAREGLHSGLAVPMVVEGEVVGVLEFFAERIRRPDADLLRLLESGASKLGLMIVRERVEIALRRSEERYRTLFSSNPTPMWVFDTETLRFLAVNDAAVAAYGWSRDELLGMTVDALHPEEDVPALRRALAALPLGPHEAGIWRQRTKDGRRIDVSLVSQPLELEGRPARVVSAHDVTERRRLEEQLRQSQRLEAIGRLAGGIAHDFNNVLLVIRGHCELLRRLAGASLERHVVEIEEAARQASRMTKQLLAFSRQQVLQPEETPLNEIVEETVAMLRPLADELTIELDLDPALPPVVVDRGQIGQVVLNLALNARDAMPGGGTLRIRTAQVELDEDYTAEQGDVAPGSYVLLQVADSGTGMDEAVRASAFEPFFTTKERGSGLGLATVHGVVSQSGGHLRLSSAPGLGTTFELYFPPAQGEAPARPQTSEPGTLAGEETILLVEDASKVRSLVGTALAAYGYRVLTAGGGAEALEILERERGSVDLLVTDIVMPGMNGPELAERALAARPGLPIVFTSGYPAETLERRNIGAAEVGFIEKPFLAAELARKVRELLDRRK